MEFSFCMIGSRGSLGLEHPLGDFTTQSASLATPHYMALGAMMYFSDKSP